MSQAAVPAFAPAAFEQDGQLAGCDVAGGLAEIPCERGAFRPGHAHEPAAEYEVAPVGRDVAVDKSEA